MSKAHNKQTKLLQEQLFSQKSTSILLPNQQIQISCKVDNFNWAIMCFANDIFCVKKNCELQLNHKN